MKTYTVALVGCGKIGAEERSAELVRPGSHLGAWLGQPRARVVALVDPSDANLANAQRQAPHAAVFHSIDEMLASVTPDILAVAVPSPLHAEMILKAVAHPIKAIVCEKPLAMHVEDGARMIASCREKRIALIVNHMRRFDPGLRETKRRLDTFGPILQAHAVYTRGIYNNGTHFIDLLRFFLGEVTEVCAMGNSLTATFTDLQGDRNVDGLLTFANGARASIQSLDSNDYSVMSIVLHGRRGRVTVTHFGYETVYAGLAECHANPGHKEIDEWHAERVGAPRSFFSSMAAHVVACLDGTEQPLSTGEDALAALKVINALVESADAGGRPIRL